MDQLKTAAAWCKRHIFWIGCFLLALTMIGSWVFSSMQLASAQKTRQSEIEKQLKAIEKVSGTTAEVDAEQKAHPNASTQAGMDAEIDATIASIVKAWQKRYNEQKAILTWPEDILGAETCNFFSKIDIPEKVSDPGRGFEKYRRAYYDEIPKFMNKICDDLGVNWQFDEEKNKKKQEELKEQEEDAARGGGGGGAFGGMGMGMGMGGPGGGGRGGDTSVIDEVNQYAVIWDEINQQLWQQKLTTFAGYDDHTGTILYPTFMQANMLQQDLWLLEAMFKNIKEINKGSLSNDTSVIRTIDHVVFGREAIIQLGKLLEIDGRLAGNSAAADDAAGPMSGGVPMMPTMGPPGGINGPGGADALHEAVAYHERYVDPNFEAIAASQVKAVLGGAALPETNLELIVAKRVPFRIAVEMDERKINEFVAICANSDFVFEVNQLRVNRHVPGEMIELNGGAPQNTEGLGGGMGGMGGMGMGGMGGMMGGDMGGAMNGMGMGGMGGAAGAPTEDLEPTPVEKRTDFMVSVEFYGVVKIYNPVRENFLRKAAGQEVVDETVDLKLAAEAEAAAAAAAAAAPAPRNPAAAQPAAAGAAQPAAPGAAQPADAGAPAAQPADAGAGEAQPAAAPGAAAVAPGNPEGAATPENANQ